MAEEKIYGVIDALKTVNRLRGKSGDPTVADLLEMMAAHRIPVTARIAQPEPGDDGECPSDDFDLLWEA